MSRGAACGPSFGMGWDVESSGAGDGLPPGLWFLLGFRVGDGPVEGEYSTSVHVWSRGWCHFQRAYDHDRVGSAGGAPPLDPSTVLRVSGRTLTGMDSGSRRPGGWGVLVGGVSRRIWPMRAASCRRGRRARRTTLSRFCWSLLRSDRVSWYATGKDRITITIERS